MYVEIVPSRDGGYGHSFKGLVTYIAHDPQQATTTERVAFVETRNLPTNDNSEVAWRVMASTAINRDEIKKRAGVGPGGRKDDGVAMHVLLSWHPSEREDLTRQEMLRAANGALKALKAEDRQAFIAAHTDTEAPHLHIALNRVSHENGKILPAYQERLRLSKWALEYEKSRGDVIIELREENWEARKNKQTPPKVKKQPRDEYELEKAARHSREAKRRVWRIKEIRKKLARLSERQKQERKTRETQLYEDYRSKVDRAKRETTNRLSKARGDVRKFYARRLRRIRHEQQAELALFHKKEATTLGKARNILKYTDWKNVFRGRDADDRRRSHLFSRAFNAFVSSGHRLETMKRRHAAERQRRQAKRLQLEEMAKKRQHTQLKQRQAVLRRQYVDNLKTTGLDSQLVRDTLSTKWKQYSRVRAALIEKFASGRRKANPDERKPRLQIERDPSARPSPTPNGDEKPRTRIRTPRKPRSRVRVKTNPSHLVPSEGAQDAARLIDQYENHVKPEYTKPRTRRKRRRRDRSRDR